MEIILREKMIPSSAAQESPAGKPSGPKPSRVRSFAQLSWYGEVPYLDEARRAAEQEDIERLLRLVARRPDFLDFDERIRKVWVAHIMRLQGDIASYETFYRPYEGAGCPPAFRKDLAQAREAAQRAELQLVRIGKGLIQGARWWKFRKDVAPTHAAIQEAYQGLLEFYRNIRRQERGSRRRWGELLQDEREKIVAQATSESRVRRGLVNLKNVVPVPPQQFLARDPIYHVLAEPGAYDPRLEPSDLAWKAVAHMLNVGEATLKRWTRRQKSG